MRLRHDKRDTRGRYADTHPCDACGKPVGVEFESDEAVCGTTDGPGFYRCQRVRCQAAMDSLSVDERRARYEAQRAR